MHGICAPAVKEMILPYAPAKKARAQRTTHFK